MIGRCCLLFLGLLVAGRIFASETSTPPATPVSSPVEATPMPVSVPPQEINGGFARYIPDESGDIDWAIKGSSANFKTEDVVTLTELHAQSYDDEIGPITIELPQGDYDIKGEHAYAPSQWIVVRRGPLVLTGKGAAWSIKQEEVRIFEEVRVLLKETGNLGLFPDE